MSITVKNMNLVTLARLGVWLDDPYGDGIRLQAIREPSVGRHAALRLIQGAPVLDGERLIREEYEARVRAHCFTSQGHLRAEVRRNCAL